jgi:hypothetical protein
LQQVAACNPSSRSQQWAVTAAGHIETNATGQCLDVNNFAGPDVDVYSCKTPGQNDLNQARDTAAACSHCPQSLVQSFVLCGRGRPAGLDAAPWGPYSLKLNGSDESVSDGRVWAWWRSALYCGRTGAAIEMRGAPQSVAYNDHASTHAHTQVPPYPCPSLLAGPHVVPVQVSQRRRALLADRRRPLHQPHSARLPAAWPRKLHDSSVLGQSAVRVWPVATRALRVRWRCAMDGRL